MGRACKSPEDDDDQQIRPLALMQLLHAEMSAPFQKRPISPARLPSPLQMLIAGIQIAAFWQLPQKEALPSLPQQLQLLLLLSLSAPAPLFEAYQPQLACFRPHASSHCMQGRRVSSLNEAHATTSKISCLQSCFLTLTELSRHAASAWSVVIVSLNSNMTSHMRMLRLAPAAFL